jgi:hypothetical protein
MLIENAELSILIALGDHNFLDLAQFVLGSDSESKNDSLPQAPVLVPCKPVWTCLSLNDILNPASEDSKCKTDYTSSEPDIMAVYGDDSGLDASVSLASAMDTDQSCENSKDNSLQ